MPPQPPDVESRGDDQAPLLTPEKNTAELVMDWDQFFPEVKNYIEKQMPTVPIDEHKIHNIELTPVLKTFGMNMAAVCVYSIVSMSFVMQMNWPVWLSLLTCMAACVLIIYTCGLLWEFMDKGGPAGSAAMFFLKAFGFFASVFYMFWRFYHYESRAYFLYPIGGVTLMLFLLYLQVLWITYMETMDGCDFGDLSKALIADTKPGKAVLELFALTWSLRPDDPEPDSDLPTLEVGMLRSPTSADDDDEEAPKVLYLNKRGAIPARTLKLDYLCWVQPHDGNHKYNSVDNKYKSDANGTYEKIVIADMEWIPLHNLFKGMDKYGSPWHRDKTFAHPCSADSTEGDGPKQVLKKLVKGGYLRYDGKMYCKLQDIENRYMRYYCHWSVQMALSCVAFAFLSLPFVLYCVKMHAMQDWYCAPPGALPEPYGADVLVDDPLRCPQPGFTRACPELCSPGIGLLHFARAANEKMKVADVELLLGALLVIVAIWIMSIIRVLAMHEKQEFLFISQLGIPTNMMRELRKMRNDFIDYISLFESCKKVFQLCASGLQKKNPRAGDGLDNLSVAAGKENVCFNDVLQPVYDLMNTGDTFEEIPLDPMAYQDGEGKPATWETVMERAIDQWKMYGKMHSLENSTSFKVLVHAPLTCGEAVGMFFTRFLNGFYEKQLETIMAAKHDVFIHDNPSAQTKRNVCMGNLIIPRSVALTHVMVNTPSSQKCIQVGDEVPSSTKSVERMLPAKIRGKEKTRDEETKRTNVSSGEELLNLFRPSPQRNPGDPFIISNFRLYGCPPVRMRTAETPMAPPPPAEGQPEAAIGRTGTYGQPARGQPARGQLPPPDNTNNCDVALLFQLAPAGVPDAQPLFNEFLAILKEMQSACKSGNRLEELALPADTPPEQRAEWNRWQEIFKMQSPDEQGASTILIQMQKSSAEELNVAWKVWEQVIYPQCVLLFLCLCFALMIPFWRCFFQGAEMYPAPVRWPLHFNGLAIFFSLALFFSIFEKEMMGLKLIRTALDKLAERTRAPPSQKEYEIYNDAFRLYDASPCPYNPSDKASMQNWKERYEVMAQNVKNWSNTESYLRIFLSSSRLASQAVLVVAAAILLALFAASLAQALSGKGMVQVDTDKLGGMLRNDTAAGLEAARQAGREVAHNVHEQLSDARDQLQSSIRGSIENATGRRLAASAVAATIALKDALQPLERAMRRPLEAQVRLLIDEHDLARYGRRLESHEGLRAGMDKAGDYLSTVKGIDLSKATKTQLLSMAMILLITYYSLRLILTIASVNDSFDAHDQMLTEQKSAHAQAQQRREKTGTQQDGEGEEEGGAPAEDSGGADASADTAASAGDEAADDAAKGEADAKDLGITAAADALKKANAARKAYETLLTTSVETSKTKASRYPIKLFGIAINMGVLIGYLAFAVTPLAEQARKAAPNLVMSGCTFVEDSWIVHNMQDKLDAATDAANLAIQTAEEKLENVTATVTGLGGGDEGEDEQVVPSFKIKEVFHEAVCKPILEAVKEQAKKMADKVDDASKAIDSQEAEEGGGERRLTELPNVRRSLQRWWRETPEDPETKLQYLRQASGELKHRAHHLLRVAPAAVHNAYLLGGLSAGLDAAMLFADPQDAGPDEDEEPDPIWQ